MTFKAAIDWKKELPLIQSLGSIGWSMAKLARKYNVSRQRMKQVIQQHLPEWQNTYGAIVNQQVKADVFFTKWGQKEKTDLYQVQRLKFRSKKANALRTGYTWDIEFGDIVWPSQCPILGTELDYFAECAQENSPSFDRIDSNLGYVKGNVIIVSWRANRIKNNGTAEEHFKIATYLTQLHTTTLALSRDCVLN